MRCGWAAAVFPDWTHEANDGWCELRAFALAALTAASLLAQTYPLESISIEGTAISHDTVAQITGLQVGSSVDKQDIARACSKLNDAGLFASIRYSYQPTATNGYAVTLQLADHTLFVPAVIDVPGVDEASVWKRLAVDYPAFDHRVPQAEAAQQYLARLLENTLAHQLAGQHLIARMESDLRTRTAVVAFQPEFLPDVHSISFQGGQEFAPAIMGDLLLKLLAGDGYTERRFRVLLENNLRRMYEEHGMYRVRFPEVTARKVDSKNVDVAVGIEEGPKYTLGIVEVIGADVPIAAMLRAASFESGELANWIELEKRISSMERPLRRQGYFETHAEPERLLDDSKHVLNLRINVRRGPLYTFGKLNVIGLPPALERKARETWRMKDGEPFDYAYSNDFFEEFARSVDFTAFRKFEASWKRAAPGIPVMDQTLSFVRR